MKQNFLRVKRDGYLVLVSTVRVIIKKEKRLKVLTKSIKIKNKISLSTGNSSLNS